MRKVLKINYFSDDDHKIEHTLQQFIDEMKNSGLKIIEIKIIWGEIWAICKINKNYGKS